MYWQITGKLNRGLCLATMHISFDCHLFLLRIINAAMTSGTQPQRVSRNTMNIEPQPRSINASSGKIMARRAWRHDMEI